MDNNCILTIVQQNMINFKSFFIVKSELFFHQINPLVGTMQLY